MATLKQRHFEWAKNMSKCGICSRVLSTKFNMLRHMGRAHPEVCSDRREEEFKKVAFPIPLENVNLLSIALCDNCIARNRGRTCLEFPDGNYALSLTMCAICLVKNRALFSILRS